MKKMVCFLIVFAMIMAPSMGFAGTYSERVSDKLQSGLTNTLFGWTDIFAEPHRYSQAGKNPWAGIGKGLVDATVNTVGGAFNLITFLLPTELTLPDGGVDLGGGKAGRRIK